MKPLPWLWPIAALLAGSALHAAEDPLDLKLVPGDAREVISVRPSTLIRTPAGRQLAALFQPGATLPAWLTKRAGLGLADLERITLVERKGGEVILVRSRSLLLRERLAKEVFADVTEGKYRTIPCYLHESTWRMLAFPDERTLAFGPAHAVEALLDGAGGESGWARTAALRVAPGGKDDFVLGIEASQLRELEPWALQERHESLLSALCVIRPLLDAQSVILAVRGDRRTRVDFEFHFADASKARKGKETARALLVLLSNYAEGFVRALEKMGRKKREGLSPGEREALALYRLAASVLKATRVEQNERTVRMSTEVADTSALVGLLGILLDAKAGPICSTCRSCAPPSDEANTPDPVANLERLARALREYEKVHGRLPPRAIFAKNGKPLLSWRVLILPYLGQNDLFEQFRLEEPWDSPHNRKLIPKMPAVFASAAGFDTPVSSYQVLHGKGLLFDGQRSLRSKDITDGPANTLLLVDVEGQPVPWTKPQDVACTADGPLTWLPGSYLRAACADGTVRHVPTRFRDPRPMPGARVRLVVPWNVTVEDKKTDEKMLRGMMTPRGGEKVDLKRTTILEKRPAKPIPQLSM
jgi:hypothetical protein